LGGGGVGNQGKRKSLTRGGKLWKNGSFKKRKKKEVRVIMDRKGGNLCFSKTWGVELEKINQNFFTVGQGGWGEGKRTRGIFEKTVYSCYSA